MERPLDTFAQEVTGESHLRVEQDLGDGFVRLEISEAQRRQALQDIKSSEDIVLELLRNSRDANSRNIFLAITRDGDNRIVTVIDDGDGIPESMHEKIFEPRVTSKLNTAHTDKWGYHGRGMALYSIAQNTASSKVIASEPSMGTSLQVVSNLTSLGEKRDQSTFPQFTLGDDGVVAIRGPKNIVRTTCEFALECKDECHIFIGSATEIAATLYNKALATTPSSKRLFAGIDDLPVAKKLCSAATPETFADIADSIGLEMSSRSARRIMDGEIDPLDDILSRIRLMRSFNGHGQTPSNQNEKAKGKMRKQAQGRTPGPNQERGQEQGETQGSNQWQGEAQGPEQAQEQRQKQGQAHTRKQNLRGTLSISAEDRAQFAVDSRQAYANLAQKYYLNENVEPTIRVANSAIVISYPIVEA